MKNRNLPGVGRQQGWSLLDPAREIARFHQGIDSLFDDVFAAGSFPVAEGVQRFDFNPAVDVEEKGEHYLLSFDLPGVKKDEVKIEIQGDQLVVSGERKQEKKEEQKGRSYYERSYGGFQRSFTLPANVKPEQIEADFRDGVLSVAVPKSEAGSAAKPVKIGERKSGILSRLLGHKEEKKGEKAA